MKLSWLRNELLEETSPKVNVTETNFWRHVAANYVGNLGNETFRENFTIAIKAQHFEFKWMFRAVQSSKVCRAACKFIEVGDNS